MSLLLPQQRQAASATGVRRLLRWLLLLQAGGFVLMVAGTNGAFTPLEVPPTTTDFASFYAAGTLANRGTPQLAYDADAHRAAEREVVAPGVAEKRFLNPPVFLLLCAPLAHLPYRTAFVVFEAASFVLWLYLTTRITGLGSPAATGLAAIPSVWWAIGWGQNTFVSAGLMAAGTAALRRSPWLAGAAFGALCFKPHFGVMLPMALVSGRQWRALLSAALVACALCATSAVQFGAEPWRAFASLVLHVGGTVETSVQLAGHVDLRSAARLAGMPVDASWAMQAMTSAMSGACVAVVWSSVAADGTLRSPDRDEAAFAVLVAATLTAMPFLLFYDLVMAGVAVAWLLRAGNRTAEGVLTPRVLSLLLGLDLLAYPAASLCHVALGALVAPSLLCLSMVRWRRSTHFAKRVTPFLPWQRTVSP